MEDFRERELQNGISINVEELSATLARELDVVFRSLKTHLNEAPGHEERKIRVVQALLRVEEVVIRVLVSAGVPQAKADEFAERIHPLIESVIVATGEKRHFIIRSGL